jgi:hypothetical protein
VRGGERGCCLTEMPTVLGFTELAQALIIRIKEDGNTGVFHEALDNSGGPIGGTPIANVPPHATGLPREIRFGRRRSRLPSPEYFLPQLSQAPCGTASNSIFNQEFIYEARQT